MAKIVHLFSDFKPRFHFFEGKKVNKKPCGGIIDAIHYLFGCGFLQGCAAQKSTQRK